MTVNSFSPQRVRNRAGMRDQQVFKPLLGDMTLTEMNFQLVLIHRLIFDPLCETGSVNSGFSVSPNSNLEVLAHYLTVQPLPSEHQG